MTGVEAALALEWSKPRLWRYETGQVPIHPNDVDTMCRLYRADTELTEVLKDLARQTKARGWWQDYANNVPVNFQLFLGLEYEASRIRQYQAEVIPGLLQSPAYTREIILHDAVAEEITPEVLEERATLRRKRQQLLTRRTPPAPALDVVLSEAALLRGFGPEVMVDQLTNLLTLDDRPNIRIRIMPFSAGFHKAFLGPFLILDFPPETSVRGPEPTTIYHEHRTGCLYLDSPDEVRTYDSIWSDLDRMAADQTASRHLIEASRERWSRA